MKKIIVLFITCSISIIGNAQKTQIIPSKIKEVVVFLNKAQLTREGKASLVKGNTELIFTGLSANIDANSLQVSGNGGLTILGMRHESNYLVAQQESPVIKQLRDSLSIYNSMIADEEVIKGIYQKEETLLISNQVIGGNDRGVTVSELKAMADFYSTRMLALANKKRKSDDRIAQYQLRHWAIQQQLNEWNAYNKKNSSSVIVEVSAAKNTNAALKLSYVVYNASWQPIYDVRAKGIDQPIELNYKANISQNTGVEWNDVKLTLSTANPNRSNVKPIIRPWYLDFQRPVLYHNAPESRNKSMRQEAAVPMEAAEMKMEKEVTTIADYTQTTQTTLNTQFDISIPYSVSSGGKATTVDIKREKLEAVYNYAVAPKLDRDAFLIARIADWDQYDLLAGQANLFFEGTYVGKTYINPKQVGDTLELSLGRDKHVVVERKPVKDFTSKKLIGANLKESYTYEISVRNTKNADISLVIEDQIPVSSNSEIEVTVTNLDGASWDQVTGKLKWEVRLSGGTQQQLTYSYEVKYPKNKRVMGL